MRKAALGQDYERAAMYRDAIADLRHTTSKTNKFERVPYTLPLAIEPQRDLAELGRVLEPARPAHADRRFRYFQHQRHVRRRLAGQFQKWPARPRELSQVQDENGRRPERFRLHGRNHPPPLHPLVARIEARARRRMDRGSEDTKIAGEQQHALQNRSPHPQSSNRKLLPASPHAARSDSDRRWQRPAQRGLRGIGKARLEPHSHSRFGQGI